MLLMARVEELMAVILLPLDRVQRKATVVVAKGVNQLQLLALLIRLC